MISGPVPSRSICPKASAMFRTYTSRLHGRRDAALPRCAGMSLDEDDRVCSGAEVERFLRSVAPAS
jgi:hypothetical protein